jgi:sulfur-oxidizing protein SoxY
MRISRRTFLSRALAGSVLALGATLLPRALMAEWPKKAFEAKSVDDALSALFDSKDTIESDKIKVDAPDIAENGSVVKIEISTDLEKVESIAIVAEKNPVPLVARFNLGENALGFVSTRIKMGETGKVIAVVKADGKLYTASKEVKVTVGGCGG